METHQIGSLSSFIEFVNSIKPSSGNFGYMHWFRSECQSHSKTQLVPGIFREYISGPSSTVEFYKKENSITSLFQIEAYPHLTQHNLVDHIVGTQFLMQHYGAETRFLDWTENALISLFFAVENIKSDYDSNIWILDPFSLNSETRKTYSGLSVDEFVLYPSLKPIADVNNYFNNDMISVKDNTIRYPIAMKPFYIDDRMKNQNACFTLFGFEAKGLTEHPTSHKFLKKIVIPRKQFRMIKRELFKIGVSYDTIYPGLEGISKKCNYAFNEYFV